MVPSSRTHFWPFTSDTVVPAEMGHTLLGLSSAALQARDVSR